MVSYGLGESCLPSHAMDLRRSVFLLCVPMCSFLTLGQTTISTGGIQGSVTDPSGALVSGAKISISNEATGRVITTKSTSGVVEFSLRFSF